MDFKVGDKVHIKYYENSGRIYENIDGILVWKDSERCMIMVEHDYGMTITGGLSAMWVTFGNFSHYKVDFEKLGIENTGIVINCEIPFSGLAIKVKNTRLARKMYPKAKVEGDWIYV